MECETIMPFALASKTTRIVLAGDHMQVQYRQSSPVSPVLVSLHIYKSPGCVLLGLSGLFSQMFEELFVNATLLQIEAIKVAVITPFALYCGLNSPFIATQLEKSRRHCLSWFYCSVQDYQYGVDAGEVRDCHAVQQHF